MRYTAAEKQEIIRLVEGSDLGINRTLQELGIHKRTFYNWYHRYGLTGGFSLYVVSMAVGNDVGFLSAFE